MPVTLMLRAWAALVFAALLLPWQSLQAQQLQPVPALKARAMDLSATLSAQELAGLEAQLKTLEDETGAQVVVLMLASTAPEDIAAYANRVAQSWKIGRKDVGDGLLIVVAKNDRRMRLEVARTLEGAVPDIMAARIIDSAMQPRFQAGDYAGGLGAAIQQLSMLIRGEKLPPPSAAQKAPESDSGLMFVALSWLLGAPLARKLLGRFKGSMLMGAGTGIAVFVLERSWEIALGAGVVAMLFTLLGFFKLLGLLLSGGRGGGGGGRGGGGGFKSGGGGRFGGGGASGGW
ncbi:YgcG family protein [Comamonas sp. GB3 AK4-5]|uniref:TPM domain-containing protein n=1 Tax=Comamonas sp. GB3 AK4-5 TaxID=3231487 RepID=UPI00351DEC0C